MKYLVSILLVVGLLAAPAGLSAKSEITVTGESIQIMDSQIKTDVVVNTTIIRAPNMYRVCVDGLEFFVVGGGKTADAIQVLDKTGKPKRCK